MLTMNRDLEEKLFERMKKNLSMDWYYDEACTKQFLILPMFTLLGFDIYSDLSVIPEYPVGENIAIAPKADYMLIKDEKEFAVVECKRLDIKINRTSCTKQLSKYFNGSKANLGILTNGRHYWFFTNFNDEDKMDVTPFIKLDLESLTFDDLLIIKDIIVNGRYKRSTNEFKNIHSELIYNSYYIENIHGKDESFKCDLICTHENGVYREYIVNYITNEINGEYIYFKFESVCSNYVISNYCKYLREQKKIFDTYGTVALRDGSLYRGLSRHRLFKKSITSAILAYNLYHFRRNPDLKYITCNEIKEKMDLKVS